MLRSTRSSRTLDKRYSFLTAIKRSPLLSLFPFFLSFFFLSLLCRLSQFGGDRMTESVASGRKWPVKSYTRTGTRSPEMRSRSARRVLHCENLTQFSRVDAATKTVREMRELSRVARGVLWLNYKNSTHLPYHLHVSFLTKHLNVKYFLELDIKIWFVARIHLKLDEKNYLMLKYLKI